MIGQLIYQKIGLYLATSAAKSATFLLTFLSGSFWTQLMICSFNTVFCWSGNLPKNSSNSLLSSLLSMTAARERPSIGISAALLMAPRRMVTFCSMGRAS